MSKELEKVEEKKSSTKKSESKKSNVKKVEEKKKETKKNSTTKSSTKNDTTKTSTAKKPVKKTTVKDKAKIDDSITLEEADSFYHVSLLAQAVCVIGVLFISVLALFEHSFTVPIEVLVGITLLIMAYNNDKMFKRKGLTVVYLVFGIICLLIGFLGYFGVTI